MRIPIPVKYIGDKYNNELSSVIPQGIGRSYALFALDEMTTKVNPTDNMNFADVISPQMYMSPKVIKSEGR